MRQHWDAAHRIPDPRGDLVARPNTRLLSEFEDMHGKLRGGPDEPSRWASGGQRLGASQG